MKPFTFPWSHQVTSLKGLFHFAYSGVWHVEDGRMYHVILCNSPMACFEGLKATGKEVRSRTRRVADLAAAISPSDNRRTRSPIVMTSSGLQSRGH